MNSQDEYVVLGAGVIGLTTALELRDRYPESRITVVAKHVPGDRTVEYCSPWAGANWLSVATDNGRQETWDEVAYMKFSRLASSTPEAGVKSMPIRAYYDNEIPDAGVLSAGTGQIWYTGMTKLRMLDMRDLGSGVEGNSADRDREGRKGASWGCELDTFIIDVQVYLPWLQHQVLSKGIVMRRQTIRSLHELLNAWSNAKAVFNCTGLGSLTMEDVKDTLLYPTRGQVLLVEAPCPLLERMYFRSPQRVNKDTTYVFPRNPGGGVILGGVREDGNWNGEPDMEFAEDIKRRCVALAPELGRVEDLKVLNHGVGLRPSRKGGARIEREVVDIGGDARLVVHNYGAGGAGYQASWGMAKEAVDLLQKNSKL